MVVRKEALARAGLFDTVLTSQEDVDLWIRLAAVTEFACSRSIGVSITRQEGSVSSNYRSMLDCAKYVMRKNRNLLSAKDRGGFWRAAMSGMLTDYAKWAYRQEGRLEAISLLVESGLQSTKHWRLIASLLVAFVRSEEV